MSVVGEAVLSASIEFLFKKLTSPELLQFARQEQIHADLKKWERILSKIHAVLEDADEKQKTKGSVKIWLGELRNLAYDVEDILDEFATEAFRRRLLLESQPQPNTTMLRKLIPTCFSSLSPRSLRFSSMMRSKIEDITVRLQDVATEKNNLDLQENSWGRSGKFRETLPTTSLVNEASVYGREKDKEAIIELLLQVEHLGDGVAVIPIIGMGGVGKTTLAQLVYNDVRVHDRFDLKVWVSVSDDFDVVRVTKSILQSLSDDFVDDRDLNLLQVKLKEKLFRKKFLLVLDDIWNEKYDDWTVLCRPFESAYTGSKIVLTTRNQGVSSMVGTLPAYPLKQLSNDDCLRVFTQHSLGTKHFAEHQDLEEIGAQIVKRCNGLPLAAKTLGGLLRGKFDPDDWEDVLTSKIWDLPEERSDILPVLRLSYHYLPKHLKRCFAYCSIFPKHYAFRKEEIILLWMAEGFLQHEIGGKNMEDLGHDCFRDLQSRSFFQQSVRGMSRFEMHDLIHDLAQWAAGEICFRIESMPEADKGWKLSENLRHLSFTDRRYDAVKMLEALHDIRHLRTFLPLMVLDPGCSPLNSDFLYHLLPKLQRLRVLSLHGQCISKLPNEIGDLKHLRYLDFSYTSIITLPETITCLYNLQSLILKRCRSLKKLCADIGNLINLRHLNISHADALEGMPLRFGKLTCLRTLSDFFVGNGFGSSLGELNSLTHLHKTLSISRLENVIDFRDAKKANLNGKNNLDVLSLEWTRTDSCNSRQAEIETEVLCMLKPPEQVKELSIRSYGGTKLPIWLGDSSFSKLVFLRFEDCSTCTSLPPVGQLPSLKYLVVKGMAGVRRVGSEFYGKGCSEYFPSLETLSFKDMEEWENWIPHGPGPEAEGFSRLRELTIVKCYKLVGRLPEHLPSLERLVIRSCHQLPTSFPSLPTLCRIEIEGCKEIVQRSTIDLCSSNSVIPSDISTNVLLEQFMQGSTQQVENLKIVGCKKLTSLWHNGIRLEQTISPSSEMFIQNCSQLLSKVAEEEAKLQKQGLPCRLKYLELSDCECLVKLPQALLSISSLREIRLSNCPKFVSFPEASLPFQLRSLRIERCNALQSLPEAWRNDDNASLQSLCFGYCDSLLYIGGVQQPPNLKWLQIISCSNLRALIDDEEVPVMNKEYITNHSSINNSLLEYLDIEGCSSLTSLWSKSELPDSLQHIRISHCSNLASLSSRGKFPKALKYLLIAYCPKLESMVERLQNNTSLESVTIWHCKSLKNLPDDLHKLCHLRAISLGYCPNLVTFPEGGLLSTKLTEICIIGCEKLEALPNFMHNLCSLQNLRLENCPRIVFFPDDGFPTNLTSLKIGDLKICKPLFEWGLHKLTSLRRLSINGRFSGVVSLPKVPTSLTGLTIKCFPDLECISSIGPNLASLELLDLSDCPKIKTFSEKGLPHSLLKLYICKCPLLEQNCRKDIGQCWPQIAHIPWISINGKDIS